jgi:hypothetical protein
VPAYLCGTHAGKNSLGPFRPLRPFSVHSRKKDSQTHRRAFAINALQRAKKILFPPPERKLAQAPGQRGDGARDFGVAQIGRFGRLGRLSPEGFSKKWFSVKPRKSNTLPNRRY